MRNPEGRRNPEEGRSMEEIGRANEDLTTILDALVEGRIDPSEIPAGIRELADRIRGAKEAERNKTLENHKKESIRLQTKLNALLASKGKFGTFQEFQDLVQGFIKNQNLRIHPHQRGIALRAVKENELSPEAIRVKIKGAEFAVDVSGDLLIVYKKETYGGGIWLPQYIEDLHTLDKYRSV